MTTALAAHGEGHQAWITCLASSADGKRLATGDAEGLVIVWDAATRRPLGRFAADSLTINTLAFSPEGDAIAVTGGGDRCLRVLSVPSGTADTLIKELPAEGLSLAWHPSRDQLACAVADGSVLLIDSSSGSTAPFPSTSKDVRHVAYSPDGERLAVAASDGSASIWNLSKATLLGQLLGHTDSIHCIAFSPDGQTLATGGRDRTVRLWDALQGQQRLVLAVLDATVSNLAFSKDCNSLVAGTETGSMTVWRVLAPSATLPKQ